MTAEILNYLELNENIPTYLGFNCIQVFSNVDSFIHSVYALKMKTLNDILMFSGVTYVTLLTLLPKNHNIDLLFAANVPLHSFKRFNEIEFDFIKGLKRFQIKPV